MLHTYHEWEANGKKYRAVYDEDYRTRGSYALETEEETRAAEDDEIDKLKRGIYVALRIITSEKKPHCESCTCPKDKWDWQETDSLWGCVVEASPEAI